MQPLGDVTPKSVPKRAGPRTLVACDQCKGRKDKCDSKGVHETCSGCRRRQIACTYETKRRRLNIAGAPDEAAVVSVEGSFVVPATSTSVVVVGPKEDLGPELPSTSHILALLSDYFATCHQGLFFSFIHEPTMVSLVTSGTAPRVLLLAVCASVVRLGRDHPSPESLKVADAWALEARQLLLNVVFGRFVTTDLMVVMLLVRYEIHRGARTAGWLLHGMATRMSIALKLNEERWEAVLLSNDDGTGTTRLVTVGAETRRRLAWSVFVEDSFINAIRADIPQIQPSSLHIRLPTSETAFVAGSPRATAYLADDSIAHGELGLLDESAYLIRACALRLRILGYIRGTATIPPWDPSSEYVQLQAAMDELVASLPASLRYHPTAFFQKNREARGVAFLTLHVFLRQLQCDTHQLDGIIRRLPPGTGAPEVFARHVKVQRLVHASAVCQMIGDALPHRGFIMDPFMGTCAFQACKVLITQRSPDSTAEAGLSDTTIRESIQISLDCLRRLSSGSEVCRRYHTSACKIVYRGGLGELLLQNESLALRSIGPLVSRRPSPDLGPLSALAVIEKELESPLSSVIPSTAGAQHLSDTVTPALHLNRTNTLDSVHTAREESHSDPLQTRPEQLEPDNGVSLWPSAAPTRRNSEAMDFWNFLNFRSEDDTGHTLDHLFGLTESQGAETQDPTSILGYPDYMPDFNHALPERP